MKIKMKPIRNVGFISKASIKVIIDIAPVHRYQEGSPSLYSTKISDKKIIALPASGCTRIKNTGKPIIANAIY